MVAGVSLTDRQRQVVYLLSTGASRTGIAGELGITTKGVDFILRGVKSATGLETIVQLVAWGIEHRAALHPGDRPASDSAAPPHAST